MFLLPRCIRGSRIDEGLVRKVGRGVRLQPSAVAPTAAVAGTAPQNGKNTLNRRAWCRAWLGMPTMNLTCLDCGLHNSYALCDIAGRPAVSCAGCGTVIALPTGIQLTMQFLDRSADKSRKAIDSLPAWLRSRYHFE